ncbi:toprim domain-containing protein [uncultured Dokdonia sp.]|uniref:toprim domain-containing protein n=1 Tax=uncultured Dokdonia sp. TaxID=575653 RepID=UPI0030EC2AA8|tara:strand:+ start:4519 stop:5397 length:879 start_codon:yes stop_codon:yes gene_type:complete
MADLNLIIQKSIITFLALYGYQPKIIKNSDYWYLSPFRTENKPSFKICSKINRWYDHGEGVGGSIIDLVMRLHKIDFHSAVMKISKKNISQAQCLQSSNSKRDLSISIVKNIRPQHPALLEYTNQRKITQEIILRHLREIHYTVIDRNYFALGFQNNKTGWEVRNKRFKGCIGHKAITLIKHNQRNIKVFEGFFDYLSFLELMKAESINSDFLILNSTSLVLESLNIIDRYDSVQLYLDNDKSGKNATQVLINNCQNITNNSHLFDGYIDLNGFLMGANFNEYKIFRIEYFK